VQPAVGERDTDVVDQVLVPELPAGEVDADERPAPPGSEPGGRLPAGSPEHVPAERDDHPRLLRQADEALGAEEPHARVLPPDQRLHAVQPAVGQAPQGLVVDPQVLPRQRRGQSGGEPVPGHLPSVALRLEQRPLAPAVRLRPVERHVGGTQQLRRIDVGDRPLHHTDAGGDLDPTTRQLHRLRHGGEDLLGERDQLPAVRRPRDEDDELVPAEPGHRQPSVAHHGHQALGDRDEQLVADLVSQRVVDRLETVEVEVAQSRPGTR
jgi:hypothetical protein